MLLSWESLSKVPVHKESFKPKTMESSGKLDHQLNLRERTCLKHLPSLQGGEQSVNDIIHLQFFFFALIFAMKVSLRNFNENCMFALFMQRSHLQTILQLNAPLRETLASLSTRSHLILITIVFLRC